jgi:enoyl-CoA hydratase
MNETTGGSGVRSEIVGVCGRIILDRPRALNALNAMMVLAFREALEIFAADDRVHCVMVTSTRPGTFCVGGDVRAIRQQRIDGQHVEADAFFKHEFALNARIAAFPKPYVTLINGLCFGGGMGLSIHGSHRIVGPLAELGMPETAIGYFPDVGGSYFLNRLPGAIGRYLALTGVRVSPADAIYSGLGTASSEEEGLAQIEAALSDGIAPEKAIGAAAREFGSSALAYNRDVIDRCFSHSSLGAIFQALEEVETVFSVKALSALRAASPASLKMTLELLDRTRAMPLRECLRIEYELACEVTRGPEFSEGVRAMLVDKDRSPIWPSARGDRR